MDKLNKYDYSQLILGALLKLNKVTIFDAWLLAEIFRKKGFVIDLKLPIKFPSNVSKLISINDDDTVTLARGMRLDRIIDAGETVKTRIRSVIGDLFDDFKIDEFINLKKEIFKKNKKEILEESKILLISTSKEDEEAIRSFGFKNLDVFSSSLTALAFFGSHPEELSKYDIFVSGTQTLLIDEESKIKDISDMIKAARGNAPVLDVRLYNYIDRFMAMVSNFNYWRKWTFTESSYVNLLNRVVEASIVNDLAKTFDRDKTFVPAVLETPPLLAKPTSKRDLKILYLDIMGKVEEGKKIAESLGLDVHFDIDCTNKISTQLPTICDYDIVIASSQYARNITFDNVEQNELCRARGLADQLYLIYKKEDIPILISPDKYDFLGLGMNVSIGYLLAGATAGFNEGVNERFRVLCKENDQEGYSDRVNRRENEFLKIVIETAIQLYSEELNPLPDAQYRDYRTYDPEYFHALEKFNKILEAKNSAIDIFDKFIKLANKCISVAKGKKCPCIVGNYGIQKTSAGFVITDLKNSENRVILKGERVEDDLIIEFRNASSTTQIFLGPNGDSKSPDIAEYLKMLKRFILFYERIEKASLNLLGESGDPIASGRKPQSNKKHVREIENRQAFKALENTSIKALLKEIRKQVKDYLFAIRRRNILDTSVGIDVSTNKNEITINTNSNGKTLCVLKFSENDESFSIQTINKKGRLSNPQSFSLTDDPLDMDDKQIEAIKSVHKKVMFSLKPLVEESKRKGRRISFARKQN